MFEPKKWEKHLERTSAIAVTPKAPFAAWVAEVAPSHPLKWSVEHLLRPREPVAWIIPSIGSFRSDEQFQDFLNGLKQELMISEFREICNDAELWPPLTTETFEFYFDLLVFVHVASSSYLQTEK